MTAEEKKIYNNGFILGIASKGAIYKTDVIESEGFTQPVRFLALYPELEIEWGILEEV